VKKPFSFAITIGEQSVSAMMPMRNGVSFAPPPLSFFFSLFSSFDSPHAAAMDRAPRAPKNVRRERSSGFVMVPTLSASGFVATRPHVNSR
jgi:hypothetical protein